MLDHLRQKIALVLEIAIDGAFHDVGSHRDVGQQRVLAILLFELRARPR
jgi:hypothetical protein